MLSKNQIKFVRSLHRKRNRREEKLFLVEGEKMADELLKSGWAVHSWYASEDWLSRHPEVSVSQRGFATSGNDMERITALNTPSPVLAVVHMPIIDPDPQPEEWCLVLDGVSDPGNLGTILRTADWFGIREVYCSPETVELWNPKVVQATMGSLFRIGLCVMNLPTWVAEQKEQGRPVYGAVLDGLPLGKGEVLSPGLLVVGSESHGISAEVDKVLTHRMSIPGRGNAESLNVSVATGILIHQCCGA